MKYCLYVLILCISQTTLAFTEQKDLKVAVFIEPPFVEIVDDQLAGFNIEVVRLLSQSLGFSPEFIQCPLARCLVMVQQGQADMILGLKKSEEREQDLIFLDPPYMVQHYPLRFFTLFSNKTVINNFEELSNFAVGTLRGATYFDKFDQSKAITKVELTTREQLVKMLLRGRIDTFIEREESILPLLPIEEYKEKLSLANYQYDKAVNSYIAISKHSDIKHHVKALTEQLNNLVSNGTIRALRVKSQI